MAKIYADTTQFIDFYQSNENPLTVFDDLDKRKSALVTTSQTINEFHRNRASTLKRLLEAFKKSTDIRSPYTTAILQACKAHKELCEMVKPNRKKAYEVVAYIEQLIRDENSDPVASRFISLFSDPAVECHKVSERIIHLAQQRKLLGNPPTTRDKHSAGDEVNWETLLARCEQDLIVVTQDGTYHDNVYLLRQEFHARTGKELLLVTKSLAEAIERIGETPSEQLIEVEKEIEKQRKNTFISFSEGGLGTFGAGSRTFIPVSGAIIPASGILTSGAAPWQNFVVEPLEPFVSGGMAPLRTCPDCQATGLFTGSVCPACGRAPDSAY